METAVVRRCRSPGSDVTSAIKRSERGPHCRIREEGTVFVEDRAITDEQLDTALAIHSRHSRVLVRADKVPRLERFVVIVDRIRGLGFQEVSLEVMKS